VKRNGGAEGIPTGITTEYFYGMQPAKTFALIINRKNNCVEISFQ